MSHNSEKEDALGALLRERIRNCGPITFHDWMAEALYNPHFGYYSSPVSQPWGRKGDYRTSPERSTLFSATFARYFALVHQELGSPPNWTILEAGGGNASFAGHCLAALKSSFPEVYNSTHFVFQERSSHSLTKARARLAEFCGKVSFITGETELSPFTGLIFANELLDAMPVHRVVLDRAQLKEVYVTFNDEGCFDYALGELSTPVLSSFFSDLNISLREGQIVEVNLDAIEWLRRSAGLLKRGFIVVVDYGGTADEILDPDLRPKGTLRGFQRHRFVDDLLQAPGKKDITSDVCWTHIVRTCLEFGLQLSLWETQDKFLLTHGILDELQHAMLSDSKGHFELIPGARELILPVGMGRRFSVLAFKKLV
jgi:SAM-dependent MidA family methyltransferase